MYCMLAHVSTTEANSLAARYFLGYAILTSVNRIPNVKRTSIN